MGKKYRVIGNDGACCKRCGKRTQVREHKEITQKQLKQPFYYSRWYRCDNPKCKTTLIMPADFIVWNEREPVIEEDRLAAIREQLTPPC